MEVKIPLTQGKYAIVDEEDEAEVKKYGWHYFHPKPNRHYAARNSGGYMHRFIMKAGKGQEVDHINGDGLDNRRCNLRICTATQNRRNNAGRANRRSKYKGVVPNGKGWSARITVDKRTLFIAHCKNEEDAAIYYNIAAQLFFGDYCRLNSI